MVSKVRFETLCMSINHLDDEIDLQGDIVLQREPRHSPLVQIVPK